MRVMYLIVALIALISACFLQEYRTSAELLKKGVGRNQMLDLDLNWTRGGIKCSTSSHVTVDCPEWVEMVPPPYPGWIYRHYYTWGIVRSLPTVLVNESSQIIPSGLDHWPPIAAWQNGRNLLSSKLPPAVPSGIFALQSELTQQYNTMAVAFLPFAAQYGHWPYPLLRNDPVEVWETAPFVGQDVAVIKSNGTLNITTIIDQYNTLYQLLQEQKVETFGGFHLLQYSDPDLIKGLGNADYYEIIVSISFGQQSNFTIPPQTKLDPWDNVKITHLNKPSSQ